MTPNPFIQALQAQQEYTNQLKEQQSQQQSQRKKKTNYGQLIASGLIADSVLNDGDIRKWAMDALGVNDLFSSTPAVTETANTIFGLSPNTPVATSTTGGTVLANQTVAPMTPTGLTASVPVQSMAGGVLGGVQTLMGLNQLRQGDYLGGTINTVAGGANLLSNFANPATATIGANVATYANPIAATYGAYQTAKLTGNMPTGSRRNISAAVSGAASGAAAGSVIPVIGTVLGGIIGGITGFLGSEMFGSSKDKDQMRRDAIRKTLRENKFLDEKFNVRLADGSLFNIGVDGKAKPEYGVLPNGKNMHAFDLNHEDPLVKQLVPNINPLVAVLTGGDKKATSDFTGYLVRAAMSNANGDYNKAKVNVQAFYQQLGAKPELLHQQIDKMLAENKIDATTAKIWKDDITRITAGMKWGDQQPKFNMNYSKMPTPPKPPPPPPPTQQNYSAEFQQRVNQGQPKTQDIGAAYANFARSFVPQQQRRELQ